MSKAALEMDRSQAGEVSGGDLGEGHGAVLQVPKALGIWDAGQFRNMPPFTLTGPIRRHPDQGHGAET